MNPVSYTVDVFAAMEALISSCSLSSSFSMVQEVKQMINPHRNQQLMPTLKARVRPKASMSNEAMNGPNPFPRSSMLKQVKVMVTGV